MPLPELCAGAHAAMRCEWGAINHVLLWNQPFNPYLSSSHKHAGLPLCCPVSPIVAAPLPSMVGAARALWSADRRCDLPTVMRVCCPHYVCSCSMRCKMAPCTLHYSGFMAANWQCICFAKRMHNRLPYTCKLNAGFQAAADVCVLCKAVCRWRILQCCPISVQCVEVVGIAFRPGEQHACLTVQTQHRAPSDSLYQKPAFQMPDHRTSKTVLGLTGSRGADCWCTKVQRRRGPYSGQQQAGLAA